MDYTGPLDTRYDPEASKILGKDHWRILTPFSYRIDAERHVSVPAGYLTDGASVPQLFWNMIPPWGKYGQAAVVHDLLCEYLQVVRNGRPERISRAYCDSVLNEAMVSLRVPDAKRLTIYGAVCLYRWTIGTEEPSATLLKRRLEAEWRE